MTRLPVVLLAVLAPSAPSLAAGPVQRPGPAASPPPRLEAGRVFERRMRGEEKHAYDVRLAVGEYLDVSMAPHDITVTFVLLAPDGKELWTEQLPGGTGPKSIEWVAKQEGDHRLSVESTSVPTRRGRYRLQVKALRAALPVDRARFAVRLTLEQAETQPRRTRTERALALETLECALALNREAGGDPDLEGRAWSWIGEIQRVDGDLTAAAEALRKAYELRKDLGPYAKGSTLMARGLVARNRREFEQALEYDFQAIELLRPIGARVSEARANEYVANVYNDLGNQERALMAEERAIDIWREEGLRVDLAGAFTLMGRFHWQAGHADEALDYHRRAEAIAREVKNDRKLADALSDLGLTYRMLADLELPAARSQKYDASLRYLQQALELQTRIKNDNGRRLVFQGFRRTYESMGDWEKALDYSAKVLELPGGADWPEFAARARIALRRGQLTEARDWIAKALTAVESSRLVLDPDLQASYEGRLANLFDLQVDILMRLHELDPGAGLDWEAFQASERGRARALFDAVRASRALGATAPALGPARQRELAQRAEDLRSEIARQAGDTPERSRLQADLVRALTDLGRVRRQDELERVAPFTLSDIQALLDEDSLLLEYDLGEHRSYLFTIGKRSWGAVVLPDAPTIDARAQLLPGLLAQRANPGSAGGGLAIMERRRRADRAFAREAAALSDLILSAVRPNPGVKRLIFVLDGALHYVPLAGLPLPPGWPSSGEAGVTETRPPLVSRYEIVTLPSVSVAAALQRARAARAGPRKRVAVFADPVFDARDARLKPSAGARARPGPGPWTGGDLARLPHTEELAKEALKDVPPDEGLAALGFAATREEALSGKLADFGTVVFATHAFLDEEFPQLSGIALSGVDEKGQPRNGVLRQHEVYGMTLNADLVVLAGCQTGIGKNIRGEGLLGLSRGFFYAGASRVVASLWKVDEGATVRLMVDFLRLSRENGQTLAAALRQAQLNLARDPRWRAPYFWAGFVIQGDWN